MYGYEGYEIVSTDSKLNQLVVRLIFLDDTLKASEIHTISPLSRFNLNDQEALDGQIQDYASAYVDGLRIEAIKGIQVADKNISFKDAKIQVDEVTKLQFKHPESLDVVAKAADIALADDIAEDTVSDQLTSKNP